MKKNIVIYFLCFATLNINAMIPDGIDELPDNSVIKKVCNAAKYKRSNNMVHDQCAEINFILTAIRWVGRCPDNMTAQECATVLLKRGCQTAFDGNSTVPVCTKLTEYHINEVRDRLKIDSELVCIASKIHPNDMKQEVRKVLKNFDDVIKSKMSRDK